MGAWELSWPCALPARLTTLQQPSAPLTTLQHPSAAFSSLQQPSAPLTSLHSDWPHAGSERLEEHLSTGEGMSLGQRGEYRGLGLGLGLGAARGVQRAGCTKEGQQCLDTCRGQGRQYDAASIGHGKETSTAWSRAGHSAHTLSMRGACEQLDADAHRVQRLELSVHLECARS